MKTILLKFAGPLQSWGVGSHFEKRHTDHYPSKSAVIGMIAACLGYRRDEDERIRALNRLDFAVRIDQPGHILKDYHTAHKYKANGSLERTYVTERYYLEDAVFVAAIGSDDESWMKEIEYAICHPFFQPSLGRRSLPPTADFILGVKDNDVVSSLKELPWQAASWYQKTGSRHLEIFADAELLNSDHVSYRKDRVISFSYHERQYGFRKEGRTFVNLNDDGIISDEHDAFGALGD